MAITKEIEVVSVVVRIDGTLEIQEVISWIEDGEVQDRNGKVRIIEPGDVIAADEDTLVKRVAGGVHTAEVKQKFIADRQARLARQTT